MRKESTSAVRGRRRSFSATGAKSWVSTVGGGGGVNRAPHLTHGTEINLRWVIDINIKGKTMRFLKANIGVYLHDLGVRKYFLNRT